MRDGPCGLKSLIRCILLLGFIAWLVGSDRLSRPLVQGVRGQKKVDRDLNAVHYWLRSQFFDTVWTQTGARPRPLGRGR
jgi:hypothetical protein